MSRLVTGLPAGGLAAALGLMAFASPAWAGQDQSWGKTVRSGADGYTAWGNTPVSALGSEVPEAEPSDGLGVRCHADGMGGCVVPLCGEPLAVGKCLMREVTITVTPSWSMTVSPPAVVLLPTASSHGSAAASAARPIRGRSADLNQASSDRRPLELGAATGQSSIGWKTDRSWQG